jgi:hypothetical protein
MMEGAVDALNNPDRGERLAAVSEIGRRIAAGTEKAAATGEANNHVHTIYSFSPYSPSQMAYRAWREGLRAVGCMDHDSVSGAEETLEACAAIGIGSTVGCEIRVSFTGTALEGRKINNPDSANIVYIAIHGIPRNRLRETDEFLRPIRAARNLRNRAMVGRLNALLPGWGIQPLDFDRDVLSISCASEGGSVTERHILSALTSRLAAQIGRGPALPGFLRDRIGAEIPERTRSYLQDGANPHFRYDMIGVLKTSLLPRLFIQPDGGECVPVSRAVAFAAGIGAIPAYAYLGDVTESPTGDKREERFEDSFLDELVPELVRLGFRAVTYMPPRNTRAQLGRVRALCLSHGLMEISGVDINSSRQSFRCPEILDPEFRHLIDSTWALIAHEKLAAADGRYALFSPDNPFAGRPLAERLNIYAELGSEIDARRPEGAIELLRARRGRDPRGLKPPGAYPRRSP